LNLAERPQAARVITRALPQIYGIKRSASGTAEQAASQEDAGRCKTKTRKTETTYSPFERFLLNGETK
jgi:hypothetical protein